jgi:hypothetical protein
VHPALLGLAHPHDHRAAEGLPPENLDAVTELDAAAVEIAQHVRITVPDPDQRPGGARLQRREQATRRGVDPAVLAGDGVTVRVDPRVTQLRRHPLHEQVRGGMLEHLRFAFHLLPAVAQAPD